jgi:hypothetical protein
VPPEWAGDPLSRSEGSISRTLRVARRRLPQKALPGRPKSAFVTTRCNFEGDRQLKVGAPHRKKDKEAYVKNKSIRLLMMRPYRMNMFMGIVCWSTLTFTRDI